MKQIVISAVNLRKGGDIDDPSSVPRFPIRMGSCTWLSSHGVGAQAGAGRLSQYPVYRVALGN